MDLVVQSSSGLLSIIGSETGESVHCGYGVTDVTAGLFAVIGNPLALRAREITGGTSHWYEASCIGKKEFKIKRFRYTLSSNKKSRLCRVYSECRVWGVA
jgi:CoA-transferase family III